MPNVAPHGLHARSDTAWKVPVNVYARVAGVWKQAEYVWAYHDGAWQLIWGRVPVQPATATATWVQPATVRVNWTAPAVNTNTHWIVRRDDGSIVATVPVGTLTVTDTRPLPRTLYSQNETVTYTVEGTDGSTSSAPRSTNAVTYNLTPAIQSTSVSYPTSTSATVTLSWTPNATYGRPQGWRIWDATGAAWRTDVLAGTATSAQISLPTAGYRGKTRSYRAVPWTQLPDGDWVQAGNAPNEEAPVKATVPKSVVLTATSNPLSNLRLTWTAPDSSYTGYEVERYLSGGPWTAHSDDTSPSNWSTTATGWMRVRATSEGGPSDWVQDGPETPINDTTAPNNVTWISFEPESSYGRLVARFTYPTDPSGVYRQVQYRVNNGSWVTLSNWSGPVTQGAQTNFTIGTFSAGQEVDCRINVRDGYGNTRTGVVRTYTLVASPIIVTATDSATWRGSGWRNDGVAGPTDVMHGRTSSGENYGYWFYGNKIGDALTGGRTLVSGAIEYCRDGSSQGSSQAIQPQIHMHQSATQPAGSRPSLGGTPTLGTGVARSGTTAGYCNFNSQWLPYLNNGSWKGFACYRATNNTNDADAGSFYMRLFPYGTNSGGRISGRVFLNHLG